MSASSDPYLYPGTGVLKNLPGLRNARKLAAFEAAKTAQRIYEIIQAPIRGDFDTEHLKAIHRHVFQDVFAWAGEFRTTMLGKAERLREPPGWFTAPHLLEHEAERIFGRLHRTKLLSGLQPVEFARQGARLLAEINTVHPFREGNGRTQRLFLGALARCSGHRLFFDVVSRERMIRASIAANHGELAMLVRMFEEITDEKRIQPLRRAIEFLTREKFNWNDVYIATTTPGQAYSGKLVGRDGDAFMMRSDDDCIFIGRSAEINPAVRTSEQISFRA